MSTPPTCIIAGGGLELNDDVALAHRDAGGLLLCTH